MFHKVIRCFLQIIIKVTFSMHFHLLIELSCVNVSLTILFPLKFAIWNDAFDELSLQDKIFLNNSSFSVVIIVLESTLILKLGAVVNSLLTVQFPIGYFSLVIWSVGPPKETLTQQLSVEKLSYQHISVLTVEFSPSLWAEGLCYKKNYLRNLAQIHTSFESDLFWPLDPVKFFKKWLWSQEILTSDRDKITELLLNGWSLNWIFQFIKISLKVKVFNRFFTFQIRSTRLTNFKVRSHDFLYSNKMIIKVLNIN